MKSIVCVALLALVFAQDSELEIQVVNVANWPENDDTNGGFLADFVYGSVANGSCIFDLPEPVMLFHVTNGHIVPGDDTNPQEGNYKVAAPANWEMVNGTFLVLIYFSRGGIFDAADVTFTCDPEDIAKLSVYSFPQNDEIAEAYSNVFYRPGYHHGDVLTITLPTAVAQFNFTDIHSEMTMAVSDNGLAFMVSGFPNPIGDDDMKEVHFSLTYLPSDDPDDYTQNWFSAGQVTVAVTKEKRQTNYIFN